MKYRAPILRAAAVLMLLAAVVPAQASNPRALVEEWNEDLAEIRPELDRLVNMSEIVAAVRHHHEKFDGNGYPDGLKGEAIPLAARILAVADTYDAITTDRPYRQSCGREVALRILQSNAGTQFDPELVDVFVRIVGGDGPPALTSVRGRFRVTRFG